jgi:acetyltransferase-like isoleucine patch superfamily enzyme
MLIEKPRIPIREILLYGWWPGFLKIFLYRLKGYRIGKGVSIGFGAVVCGERVVIGEHTSIGFLTIVRGREIRLGPYVHIGSMTFLDTPYIEIGEGTKINEQVFVGGLQLPDSRFVVGRNCSIMQMSFINPARSVVMGDDTGIGGHCLIFGHSSWLNQFEGYAVDFAPIEIGSNVGLAWRTFVLPGAKIGDGTMVGANSVVSGTLPPRSMAVGFPARVVAGPPAFPRNVSDQEKVEMFRRIVAEMIQVFVGSGLNCTKMDDRYEIRKPNTGWRLGKAKSWLMQVTDGDVRQAAEHLNGPLPNVFVSLCEIPADVRELFSAKAISWIDITKKAQSRLSNDLSDEVSNFFKRYGVRTLRYPAASVSGSFEAAKSK